MKKIPMLIKDKFLRGFQFRSLIYFIEITKFQMILLIIPIFLLTAYEVFPQEKPSLKDAFKN